MCVCVCACVCVCVCVCDVADSSICNTLFASFICKEVTDGHSILATDDRVMCEDAGHQTLQLWSYVLIALIACGVPITAATFLRRANAARPPVDAGLQHRVTSDFGLDLPGTADLINDIQFGSSYEFLAAAYRSPLYMWESVDSELPVVARARVMSTPVNP